MLLNGLLVVSTFALHKLTDLALAVHIRLSAILCRVVGHEWCYIAVAGLDGKPIYFKSCARCEKTEELV
jgi:hypothetical protein